MGGGDGPEVAFDRPVAKRLVAGGPRLRLQAAAAGDADLKRCMGDAEPLANPANEPCFGAAFRPQAVVDGRGLDQSGPGGRRK